MELIIYLLLKFKWIKNWRIIIPLATSSKTLSIKSHATSPRRSKTTATPWNIPSPTSSSPKNSTLKSKPTLPIKTNCFSSPRTSEPARCRPLFNPNTTQKIRTTPISKRATLQPDRTQWNWTNNRKCSKGSLKQSPTSNRALSMRVNRTSRSSRTNIASPCNSFNNRRSSKPLRSTTN